MRYGYLQNKQQYSKLSEPPELKVVSDVEAPSFSIESLVNYCVDIFNE
jgi:hypothetical protein